MSLTRALSCPIAGKDYIYTPDNPSAPQTFLPTALANEVFLDATCPNPFCAGSTKRGQDRAEGEGAQGENEEVGARKEKRVKITEWMEVGEGEDQGTIGHSNLSLFERYEEKEE